MVKRTLLLLAGVVVAMLAIVAGPALSAHPYRPEPVDFELSAPAALSAAHAGGTYTSPALRAPKRFDIVGVRWRGGATRNLHLQLRARRDGGRWTRWREVPAETADGPDPGRAEPVTRGVSAPAWAGQSDWVQYRATRPLAGAKLHFVNTTGTATAEDRRLTAFRRTINRGVLALAGAGTPRARAAEAQPDIVPRDAWGAADCPPRQTPDYGEVKSAFIHHTVSLNDYSQAEAPAIVLGICRYHRNSNGWNDIGYNFLVDKYGTIYEGRAGGIDQAVIGAQAQGWNAQSTGIANIGTFTDVPQSSEALSAMAKLIRWKLPLQGVPTAGTVQLTSAGGDSNRYAAGTVVTMDRVTGHRDGNNTSCPGNALYAQLPELRRRVGSLQPVAPTLGTQGATKLVITAVPTVLAYPQGASVTGRLVTFDGGSVGSAPVQLQRQTTGGGFKTIARGTTSGDGGFAFPFTPSKRSVVRVRFPGDGGHGATDSTPAVVQVRPALSASLPARRISAKGLLRVSGQIKPSKGSVRLVLFRRSGKGKHGKLGASQIAVRGGRYRGRFRINNAGLYQLYVAFFGDPKNLAVSTAPVYLRVGGGSLPANPQQPSTDGGTGAQTPPTSNETGGTTAKP